MTILLGYFLAAIFPPFALIPTIVLAVRRDWGHVVGVLIAIALSVWVRYAFLMPPEGSY